MEIPLFASKKLPSCFVFLFHFPPRNFLLLPCFIFRPNFIVHGAEECAWENTGLAALLAAPRTLRSRRPSAKPFPPLTEAAVAPFTCESLTCLAGRVAACKPLVLVQMAFFFLFPFPLLLLIQLI